MRKLSRFLVFVIAIIMVLTTAGCGEGYKKSIIYFELEEKPLTVDPQTASSDSELLIVRNIYEGLLRKDANGKIVYGACEEMKKDGLTYTFKLKENLKWSSGEDLTAKDFEFGLKRAVSKETNATFAYRLMCIKGAEEVYKNGADLSTLGVTAKDDRTLVITLEYEDKDFEETLTTSVAMPCNEEFFEECVGKYGLERKYIISNGSYALTKWNKETFGIRLYSNDEYQGDFEANNAAVFLSKNEEEEPLTLLKENKVDMAFVENSVLDEVRKEGFNLISKENICWVMTVDNDYSADVRKAFALANSTSVYEKNLLSGFRAATSLYPAVLGVKNADNVGVTQYDLTTALSIFSSAVADMEDKKFPSTTLYYYDDADFKPVITSIVAHWQNNLGAFINIKGETSLENIKGELRDKTRYFAVFPIKIANASATEYLLNFGIEYKNSDLAAIQTELLADNTLIPLAFETTDIAYIKGFENVVAESGNGYIDFSFIIKR